VVSARRNPCAAVRGTHAQALPVEGFDDLGREDRLELLGIPVLVRQAKSTEPGELRRAHAA